MLRPARRQSRGDAAVGEAVFGLSPAGLTVRDAPGAAEALALGRRHRGQPGRADDPQPDLADLLVCHQEVLGELRGVVIIECGADYLPRLALPLARVAVILGGSAYVSALQADRGAARRERDEARAAAKGTKAVEAVAAKAAARSATSRASRDRGLTAPASDDGPVAPVLRQVLESGR